MPRLFRPVATRGVDGGEIGGQFRGENRAANLKLESTGSKLETGIHERTPWAAQKSDDAAEIVSFA